MIVSSAAEFDQAMRTLKLPADASATPDGVFMVEPTAFHISTETAADNVYMNLEQEADAGRALAQHRALAHAISACGIPVMRFPGRAETPDAVFPNNVFGTIPGRFIIGRMLHPERQQETLRQDIRKAFTELLNYELYDLSRQDLVAELTGPLIIDRERRIGFCGMTQRVDAAGCRAMHDAFDLRLTFQFELNANEYHTNVVMGILASRACVIHAGSFADPQVPQAIARAFPDRTLFLDDNEKAGFAGNCICITERDLFMSKTAADSLRADSRAKLESWDFQIHSIELDELEKAGGSLRCMIGEIF